METMSPFPTPEDAAAALADAEASRTLLARSLVLPSYFYGSIGTAVAVSIATTALGVADVGSWAMWSLGAGVVTSLLVAGIQLARFRRLNGVWLGGFASRVVGGTAAVASVTSGLAYGGALWAAFAGLWWLVALCSIGGGVGYALSGRRWVRIYRAEPAKYSRGESAAWLAVLGAGAVAGLVLLLVVGR
jgi:hypothetical protein